MNTDIIDDEELSVEAVGLYLLMRASSHALVRLFLDKCVKNSIKGLTKYTIGIKDLRDNFDTVNTTDSELQQIVNEFLESFAETMTLMPGVDMEYINENGIGYVTMGEKEVYIFNYIDTVVKVTNIRSV